MYYLNNEFAALLFNLYHYYKYVEMGVIYQWFQRLDDMQAVSLVMFEVVVLGL